MKEKKEEWCNSESLNPRSVGPCPEFRGLREHSIDQSQLGEDRKVDTTQLFANEHEFLKAEKWSLEKEIASISSRNFRRIYCMVVAGFGMIKRFI